MGASKYFLPFELKSVFIESRVELPAESSFPMTLNIDGQELEVRDEHVKRLQRTENMAGEWFIPHVVEPAFGIDRIIWHLLDHCYTETEKSGETYTLMTIPEIIAPVDVTVLPLYEKDGMGELAKSIHRDLCSRRNVFSIYDASGSIGRRYARADEIGVPWCITVDHDSLNDKTVTLRSRDSGEQIRVPISELEF